MGGTGLEFVAINPCAEKDFGHPAEPGAAECAAPYPNSLFPPDLGYLISEWPGLPASVRTRILFLVVEEKASSSPP